MKDEKTIDPKHIQSIQYLEEMRENSHIVVKLLSTDSSCKKSTVLDMCLLKKDKIELISYDTFLKKDKKYFLLRLFTNDSKYSIYIDFRKCTKTHYFEIKEENRYGDEPVFKSLIDLNLFVSKQLNISAEFCRS